MSNFILGMPNINLLLKTDMLILSKCLISDINWYYTRISIAGISIQKTARWLLKQINKMLCNAAI